MIGIFDSGVGGLTVAKEVLKHLPERRIIYFGDTARLPYGTKGSAFVQKYSIKITEWLLKRGAEAIVVACHTSSAWASETLKKKFKDVPIFEMITPAVADALKKTKNKRIGVIGTPGTIKSGAYEKRLLSADPSLKVYAKACPLFVPLVEEGWVSGGVVKEIIKKYLCPLKDKKIDTLILACTHYPLLEKEIKKAVGSKVKIINPAESLAKELKASLKKVSESGPKKSDKDHLFFFSDEPYNLKKISHLCFQKHIEVKVEDPF